MNKSNQFHTSNCQIIIPYTLIKYVHSELANFPLIGRNKSKYFIQIY